MTVTLPPELGERVAERARAEGMSEAAFVERVLREATAPPPGENVPLLEWPGRVLTDLRRQDLYDDAR